MGLWLYIALLRHMEPPNSPVESYNPPLAALLPPPPTPPPPAHPPFIRAIYDITAVVKKVAQNPAVLASYCR